jgi:hypothetical protein
LYLTTVDSAQFCNDVKDTEYVLSRSVFNEDTRDFAMVQIKVDCPRPGLVREFTCENGVMSFDKQVRRIALS